MIEKDKLKVGLLVWWSADRYQMSWSCPAIVTEVTEEWFTVKSLDDFKETKPIRMDEEPGLDKSVRNTEMRICTLDEVKGYFNERTKGLEDKVARAQKVLNDAIMSLYDFSAKTKAFLNEMK